MKQTMLSAGKLLDEHGRLQQAGYATSLVREYDREAIRASRLRIKEWDYYLIYNGSFGVALTLADNAYMGLISASFLDFENRTERTVSPMFFFPMGQTHLPASSGAGVSRKTLKHAQIQFLHEGEGRRLRARIENFANGRPFACDILLTEEPRD